MSSQLRIRSLHIGDEVIISEDWLRSNSFPPDADSAKGVVTAFRPGGPDVVASVEWDLADMPGVLSEACLRRIARREDIVGLLSLETQMTARLLGVERLTELREALASQPGADELFGHIAALEDRVEHLAQYYEEFLIPELERRSGVLEP